MTKRTDDVVVAIITLYKKFGGKTVNSASVKMALTTSHLIFKQKSLILLH
jgi:hypothetical protein